MNSQDRDRGELEAAIQAFLVEGGDRSIASANRIEVMLDELFADDDRFAEYIELLACYRPFGGEGLISEGQILPRLRSLHALVQS